MKPPIPPTLPPLRRVWPAYCVLVVILLLTLIAARNVALVKQTAERASFDHAAEEKREQFQRAMNAHLILLDGLRGLTNAKLGMSSAQFDSYVEALQLRDRYPGARSLGFVWRVLEHRKAADLEKIKALGLPSFRIWPDSPGPEWYPVVYAAPRDPGGNTQVGYDLSSESVIGDALRRAVEIGRPAVSGKFVSAQQPSSGAGEARFLLLAPMYWGAMTPSTTESRAEQLMGVLFCSFRLDDLFKGFADTRLNPEIEFKVYDGGILDSGHLLHDSTTHSTERSQAPAFTLTRSLTVADRTWTVVFSQASALGQGASRSLNLFIAISGTAIGFLMFGMMLARARERMVVEYHAEEQRLSEARFRRLVEQSIVGIYVIQDDRFVYVNPKMLEIYGCAREEELTTPPMLHFVAEESQASVKANIAKRLTGEVESIHYEVKGLRLDRTPIDLETHGGRVEFNGRPAVLGSLIDITARKRGEAEVERQRAELQVVLDTVPALIFYKDTSHRVVRVNEEAVRVVGLPKEALEGRTDQELGRVHAEEYCLDEDEVMATGQAKRGIIEPLETSRGIRWLQTDKIPDRDASGRIVGIVGFAVDITERREAEKKVQAQLSRLDLLSRTTRAIAERHDLRSIFQVVIRSLEEHLSVDFSCVCLYDPAAETLTVSCVGARSAKLAVELALSEETRIVIDQNGLSQCLRGQLVYEPDLAQVEFPFPQRLRRAGLRSLVAAPLLVESKVFGVLLAARRQAESFSSGECEFLRHLSEHVALAANQAQLYSALQKAYEELRQTQQSAMQQERLRALGQMASGVAHDINNAISPISLYTESLIESEPSLSERSRGYLGTIQHAIEDVAATVVRLQNFYRQREPQMALTAVPLNRLVQQALDLTHARWSDMMQERGVTIESRTDLAPELPAIMGVESEIRDALTNLILNAVDAMPNGGTLALRTRVVAQGEPTTGDAAKSRHVCLEVADTGTGMDEETRRRCLEPFFTTKGERGTGLGLAMVYGMAQRHGGEVVVESTPGEGTTVRLVFPAVIVESAAPMRPAAVPTGPMPPLKILIVDDDPLLIMALRDILETEGHQVTAADGGRKGIEAFLAAQQSGEPFAVVFTDLGMPHVDGRKVAEAVKQASPSTPVLMLTGWGQRMVEEGDIPQHVDLVMSKPPKMRELREALATYVPGGTA